MYTRREVQSGEDPEADGQRGACRRRDEDPTQRREQHERAGLQAGHDDAGPVVRCSPGGRPVFPVRCSSRSREHRGRGQPLGGHVELVLVAENCAHRPPLHVEPFVRQPRVDPGTPVFGNESHLPTSNARGSASSLPYCSQSRLSCWQATMPISHNPLGKKIAAICDQIDLRSDAVMHRILASAMYSGVLKHVFHHCTTNRHVKGQAGRSRSISLIPRGR